MPDTDNLLRYSADSTGQFTTGVGDPLTSVINIGPNNKAVSDISAQTIHSALDKGLNLEIKVNWSNRTGSAVEAAGVQVFGDISPPNIAGTDKVTNEFSISYTDSTNTDKTYYFTLMPSMETTGRLNNQGMSVPEVKPGLMLRTSMSIKKFSIPGSSPVFQTLGIDQKIMQLVGAFIGNEGVNKAAQGASVLYGVDSNITLDSYTRAKEFDEDVVQSGRPVKLLINSETHMKDAPQNVTYKALIQSFRYFARTSDRVYYALDLLIMDYALNKVNPS